MQKMAIRHTKEGYNECKRWQEGIQRKVIMNAKDGKKAYKGRPRGRGETERRSN